MYSNNTQHNGIGLNLIRKKVIITRPVGAWGNPSYDSMNWMSTGGMFVCLIMGN